MEELRTAGLDRRFAELKRLGNHMESLWRDLSDFYLPTRGRFDDSDTENRGNTGQPKILDGTGTQCLSIARSGMLASIAGPSSTWFEQGTVRPILNDDKSVKVWMRRLRDIELAIFDRSNFYAGLSMLWRDELLYGTGAMIILPDADNVIRCEVFPIGSYWIDRDERGRVDTIVREFSMSVRSVIAEFGMSAVSDATRAMYHSGQRSKQLTIRHLIARNEAHQQGRLGTMGFPFHDVYWEKQAVNAEGETTWSQGLGDGPGAGVLRTGGWQEFPVVVASWDRNDDEVWGSRCPAIDALGDVMELQAERRTYVNGRNKMVNPPLVGGPGIEQRPISWLAGGRTIDPDMAGGGTGLKELHEQRLPLADLNADMVEIRERISNAFMVQFWLKLMTDQRAQPATAEEIRALDRERATILGPVQERQNDEVLDPAIERVTNMLIRQSEPFWALGADGVLPLPPEQLIKEPLRTKYISEISVQQRVVSISGIERHAQFLAGYAEVQPEMMDTVNWDMIAAEHAKAVGVPPTVPRAPEEVMAMRQQRLQQQQQQMLREQMPGLAKAAKDLGETKTDGNTALDAVVQAGAAGG